VNVNLEDIYNGREIEMQYTKQIMCPWCRGSGAESEKDYKTCPHCGGKGNVVEKRQIMPGFFQNMQVE
jgi:DnaJ-related protein SCJ1